jgi:nucleotide-binding universal stress UspA family protein
VDDMKILFATAGPVTAQENADYVVTIAKRLGAELIVMHVINKENENEKGDKALRILFESGKKARVQVTGVLQTGDIISQIIKMAETESAAIIIMGASKENNMNQWLSSDTKKRTKIPVLVIPNEGSPEK